MFILDKWANAINLIDTFKGLIAMSPGDIFECKMLHSYCYESEWFTFIIGDRLILLETKECDNFYGCYHEFFWVGYGQKVIMYGYSLDNFEKLNV